MSANNRMIVAMLVVAAVVAGFWILLLSPKRKEATELSTEASQAKASLAQAQAEVSQALQAERQFPVAYQQLVVLGKAVPNGDETPSLLVQLNHLAKHAHVRFQDLVLTPSSGGSAEAPVPTPPPAEESGPGGTASQVSATEVAASTLPLGAAIGPAGLAVMPYELNFTGNFFHLADFIRGLDSLVKTENSKVEVSGRLLTIDSFSLEGAEAGFPQLEATFFITTYLTPPGQGITAGATLAAPEALTGTPVSTTTGGTP